MKKIIRPQSKQDLRNIIEKEIKLNGNTCDLNHIDVSSLPNLGEIFEYSDFNGNISKWDVRNATHMYSMFKNSKFNGDISNWNVSNAKNTRYMFYKSEFNGDISKWDVSKIKNADYMFENLKFDKDLTNWTPLSIEDRDDMFKNCPAPVPYWAIAENIKESIEENITIIKNLENHENHLTQKIIIEKKIKI